MTENEFPGSRPGPRARVDAEEMAKIKKIADEARNTDPHRPLPDISVFEHHRYGGKGARTSLSYSYVGDDWNDIISSIIVHSGTWEFWEHANFQGRCLTLGPDYYPTLEEWWHDRISSFRAIAM